MNFEVKSESDIALFVVVILLFAIAAFFIIWQLVDHKDVKEDMNDSDLGGPEAFNKPKEGYYTDEMGRRWQIGEEVEEQNIKGAYTAPLNVPQDEPEQETQYDTPVPTTGFAIRIKGKRFFSTKSEEMSDQAVIPIMHWESVKNKNWYWRITSSNNGLILARGSEGYSSEQKCLQGLRATVQEILRASGVVTQEPVHDMSKRVYDPNA